MGFPERLQSIIEEQRISKYKIAKAIDISASTVSNYIKGKTKPDSTKLTVLCKLLGVNKAWLQTGDGPKYITEEPQTVYNRTPADIDDNQSPGKSTRKYTGKRYANYVVDPKNSGYSFSKLKINVHQARQIFYI